MTVKKFRVYLASDIQKEEEWLTAMSAKGLHFRKNRFGLYYFDEDQDKAYVYQIDFQQNVDKTYFQLYEDAGWESVDEFMCMFHYFRRDAKLPGVAKLYSDERSMQDSFQKMLKFYVMIFILLVVLMLPNMLAWQGFFVQKMALGINALVIILYIFLFIGLRRRIRSFDNQRS